MYSYETTGNGLTLEIFKNGQSITFMQGDDAANLLADLEKCKTGEEEQYYLSAYDY